MPKQGEPVGETRQPVWGDRWGLAQKNPNKLGNPESQTCLGMFEAVGLDQIQRPGSVSRLKAPVHVQLAIDALVVRANGADGDKEPICDLGCGQGGGQKAQHVQLALGERLHERLGQSQGFGAQEGRL